MNLSTTGIDNKIGSQNEKTDTMSTNSEEALKEKRSELKEVQNQIAELQERQRVLESAIKDSETKNAEINQARTIYEQFFNSSTQQLRDQRVLINQKLELAKTAIKEKVGQIDSQVAEFDKKLELDEKTVADAFRKSQSSTAASQEAESALKEKQENYEKSKKPARETEASMKELSNLLDQAKKAETQSDYVALYFLTAEAKKISDSVQVQSVDDFADALKKAQEELDNLKRAAVENKVKADNDTKSYIKIKEEYDVKISNRRTNLLSALKLIG